MDGIHTKTEVVQKTIYTRKGGEEVHFINGYRKIRRIFGVPVLVIEYRSVKALSIVDLAKKWVDGVNA